MKHSGFRQSFVLSALCSAMLVAAAPAWAVTDQEILNDVNTTDEIVTNGMGLQGQRYSPLTTLNTDNIKDSR
jgi:alcohol dehydrogenase (cytochrome c)